MKGRIQRFIRHLGQTVLEAPVETALSLLVFGYCSASQRGIVFLGREYAALFPLFFTFSFLCNKWLKKMPQRIVYYLSPLPAVAFLWINTDDWIGSASYFVALAIGLLLVFVSAPLKDNFRFVWNILRYVRNIGLAILVALVTQFFLSAIYFSALYIFNLTDYGFDRLYIDLSLFVGLVFFPLAFLTFDRQGKEGVPFRTGRLPEILLNYIVTPALLIYTLILYAYLVRIAAQWSLPKGGVASLIFGFMLVAVAAKACRTAFPIRLYGWYYDRFSLIALPLLILFWIGTLYRIHQYGLTQDRVYLTVCGAIMTFTALLFLFKRWGRYLYAFVFSIIALALFTYVPGLTARELGLQSQMKRIDRMAERIGLPRDADGKFLLQQRPVSDTVYRREYRGLYDAYEYVASRQGEDFMANRYGIGDQWDLAREIIPSALHDYAVYGLDSYLEETERIELVSTEASLDIRGFSRLVPFYAYGDSGLYPQFYRDSLFLYSRRDERPVFSESFEKIWAQSLHRAGLSGKDIPPDTLRAHAEALLVYDRDSVRLLFRSMVLEQDEGDTLKICNLDPACYLIR